MARKTRKIRHERFLGAGFFPSELPSCFYSETFASHRDSLWQSFTPPPTRKDEKPDYYFYKSNKASINFPRFQREDRRHSYMNPISFFFLSKVLADNYVNLRKLNRQSRLSVAPSIFDWVGSRTLIPPSFGTRDTQNSSLNARFEILAEADIAGFFHSVYTHSIAWAVHTKAVAKGRRNDMTLYGNLIDLLVRNGQDGQTIGIPVGPETSRLIAEVLGSAIDRSIQKSLKINTRGKTSGERRAMRFVDDFTFGCSSTDEAEKVIATIREAVNSFELELNNSKTGTRASAPFVRAGWREHLRGFLPATPPYDPASLNRYFYNVQTVSKDNGEIDVLKYAVKAATRVFLETESWPVVQDYLLSSYRQSPTVLPQIVDVFILRELARGDVSKPLLADFINSRIPVLADRQKNGEILWMLFLCLSLSLRLHPRTVARLLSIEDGAIALLVADARRAGLIPATTDFAFWNDSLTIDGLNGPMWLYSYESSMKQLNGVAGIAHIAAHPYFRFLAEKKIEFYRSGLSHFNANAILRAQRRDNLRRRLMLMRLEDDLGESIDDFDDVFNEEEDDDGDIYA
jgi:hypothetical protein